MKKWVLFLGITTNVVFAQTSNLGELTVNEGTALSIVKSFENKKDGVVVNDGDFLLYSNLINNGIFTFLSTSGQTYLTGNNAQQIKGDEFIELNTLVVNNLSREGISLSNFLTIDKEAQFLKGVLNKTPEGKITFLRNALASNASNESYFKGEVEKLGNKDFEFPLGDKDVYRPIHISKPKKSTDVFTSKYHRESSDVKHSHSRKEGVISVIDTNEYWEVERNVGDSEVLITLTIDEDVISPEVFNGSISGIHIVRWNEAEDLWIDEGGIIEESNGVAKVTTILKLPKYGVFALARVKEDLLLTNGCLSVYNSISSNDDGVNDFLRIKCIEQFPNTVQIFNRWGNRVFQTKDYNNNTNNFKGISTGNTTINPGSKLPSGTYYYILNYEHEGRMLKKGGYLYITTN